MHGDGAARKKPCKTSRGTHARETRQWMDELRLVCFQGGMDGDFYRKAWAWRHSIAARCVVCVRNVFFSIKLWMVTKQVQNNPLLLLVLAPKVVQMVLRSRMGLMHASLSKAVYINCEPRPSRAGPGLCRTLSRFSCDTTLDTEQMHIVLGGQNIYYHSAVRSSWRGKNK